VLAALSDAEKSLNQYDHALPSIAAQETAAATNWATPHSPISRPRSPCRTPVPRRTWSRCTKRLAGMGSTDGTVASACAVQMSVSLHSIVFIGYSSIRHGLRACRERRLSDSADTCSRLAAAICPIQINRPLLACKRLSRQRFCLYALERKSRCLINIEKSVSGSNGLIRESFIPASKQRILSSAKALAVMAKIGVSR